MAIFPALALGTSMTGNGAPSGEHFNLNLIANNQKANKMNNNKGHRIFVNPKDVTKIKLAKSGSLEVLDANGTNYNDASFQLLNPVAEDSDKTSYSIYARALGKKTGEATITTCAHDYSGDPVCSDSSWVLENNRGQSKFENVSAELLYLKKGSETYPLFHEAFQDYFWKYTNTDGISLAELRIYPEGYMPDDDDEDKPDSCVSAEIDEENRVVRYYDVQDGFEGVDISTGTIYAMSDKTGMNSDLVEENGVLVEMQGETLIFDPYATLFSTGDSRYNFIHVSPQGEITWFNAYYLCPETKELLVRVTDAPNAPWADSDKVQALRNYIKKVLDDTVPYRGSY